MIRAFKRAAVRGAAAVALLLGWHSTGHAANGTLQQRLLTFSDTASNTVTFTVATGLGAGEAASLLLDFTGDGNGALPASEPFPTPAAVTFAFTYAGGPLGALNFTAAQAGAANGFSASSGVATPNVDLSVTKPASTFGRYVITLTFPTGAGGLASNWTLAIAGLPTSPAIRATIYIDAGKFSALTTTGPCTTGGTPICPAGQTCKGPCPFPAPYCVTHPWNCFREKIWIPVWERWPPPGPGPCLCPEPWKEKFGEEFERTILSFVALNKDGTELGSGQAKQIQLTVTGGRAVGALVDVGGGEYAQMLESRKGEASPRVSANIAGAAGAEFIAGPAVAAAPPLTKVLGILLVLAVAVAGYLAWRNRGASTRQG